MSEPLVIKTLTSSLERWVEGQKAVLASLQKAEEQLKGADRLELVLATRVAFRHMIKTLEAFDRWLQDHFIVGHMPREMLEEVRGRVWEIMRMLLELDIEHTSQFKEHLAKLAREGRLNPLLAVQGVERERAPGVL